ncbi:cyclic lactone autoinducer peptide [Romboutsia ilealis]|uniref:Cyclic lactone autoinducer peptide n=1 Tax=Romboutsia faecis TaxID=2764597 RepID=A0ABR7JKE4_9FIRM|nr:cyclic lactone autoinducer peptide [Romboutsia faecis]MBC5995401.1 cyclic lactone autoinducer peptide [Romboutsia faecis]MRN24357.1 cyclic lactone autoinducer peptide [Romboutsia ilealis]
MKKVAVKLMKVCGPLVLSVAFLSSSSTSIWHIHQPKKPAKLNKC